MAIRRRYHAVLYIIATIAIVAMFLQLNLLRSIKQTYVPMVRREVPHCEPLPRKDQEKSTDLMNSIEEIYTNPYDETDQNSLKSCTWRKRLNKYLQDIMASPDLPDVDPKVLQQEFQNATDLVTLYELDYRFLQDLKSYPQFSVFTYGLEFDEPSGHNVMTSYYKHAGSEDFCEIILNPEKHANLGFPKGQENDTNFNPLKTFFKRDCTTDIDKSQNPVPEMKSRYYYITPDFDAVHKIDDQQITMYLIKTVQAVIAANGVVASGKAQLHPVMCIQFPELPKPEVTEEVPVYDEVFVISQHYATEVYHSIAENLSRLAPYIAMIKNMPSLKIHAGDTKLVRYLLEMLGVGSERLISGLVRAKTVYMPQGTGCGLPRPLHIQLFSRAVRKQILQKFPAAAAASQGKGKNILLVQRSNIRRFLQHDEILESLRKIAKDVEGNVTVFSDDPLPSFDRMFEMFATADIIVAPHGAGLTNIVFSKPGVAVVEGVCSTPNMNLCYMMLSYLVGLKYYGIPSVEKYPATPGGGCPHINIKSVEEIERAVRQYLPR